MKIRSISLYLTAVALLAVGCASDSELANVGEVKAFNGGSNAPTGKPRQDITPVSSVRAPKDFVVKTTAYTHTEADSLQYGTKNAYGTDLKFGSVRSAAADWSRYPVGTVFKIKGLPYDYVVDDYGSALVGTDTIDLYKPSKSEMNAWGARNVGIEVVQWGSYDKSLEILDGRKGKAGHVDEMLGTLKGKINKVPEELRNGFRTN